MKEKIHRPAPKDEDVIEPEDRTITVPPAEEITAKSEEEIAEIKRLQEEYIADYAKRYNLSLPQAKAQIDYMLTKMRKKQRAEYVKKEVNAGKVKGAYTRKGKRATIRHNNK